MSTIPPNDPARPKTAMYRFFQWVTSTGWGRKVAMVFAARLDPWLLRHTKGRVSTSPGVRQVLLSVPGRKSGDLRTTALLYFTQADEVILIASSFGRDKHPAWYLNLKAAGRATLTAGGRTGEYVAREETDDAERERLLGLAGTMFSAYAGYVQRTERRIPVMRLSPGSSG